MPGREATERGLSKEAGARVHPTVSPDKGPFSRKLPTSRNKYEHFCEDGWRPTDYAKSRSSNNSSATSMATQQ